MSALVPTRQSADDGAAATVKARRSPLPWILTGFCAALGLAIGVLVLFGANSEGFRAALRATARLNFLLFWPAYVGGALTKLFGGAFAGVRNNSRNFGLAFAAALSVHLGLVACLCSDGSVPDVKTFIIFGTAAFLVYLLAFQSTPYLQKATLNRLWPLMQALSINYIALVFVKDFLGPGIGSLQNLLVHGTVNSREIILYAPFTVISILGPMLRLAAYIQRRVQQQVSKSPVSQGPCLKSHIELNQLL